MELFVAHIDGQMESQFEDLRATLVREAYRIMETRPVVRFVQDRRVLRSIIDGMGLRARIVKAARETTARLAPFVGLATIEDLRALEQDMLRREKH